MRIVHPKVILLAETSLLTSEIPEYNQYENFLDAVEAPEWQTDASSEGELLIEMAGRMCYRSWKPGLNPNVTKIREGNKEYIGNILKQSHGSVLEHSSTTWAFLNVSRVFTHELVRHRAGTAVSQESLRYVRLEDIPFAASSELPEHETTVAVEFLEGIQKNLASNFCLDQSKNFAYKKRKTSAMRRLAPIGLATNIIWTCNLRELRHVIALRTSSGAEEEIRKVFQQVAKVCKERYPAVFQDFTVNDQGEWVPQHWKV